jgi:isoleucyl-tRNA synthetase
MDEYGADILRLWVASSDYSGDLRIGKEILKGTADKYRRLRNTIRWMLGALDGYGIDDAPLFHPENSLEQWALHKLSQVTASVLKSYDAYQYGQGLQILFDFCTNDLSSFYFDVRKDMLYCNGAECPQRMDLRRTIHIILVQILKLIAPICPFTADEAWGYIGTDTIHLTQFDTVIYDFSDAFDATEQVRHVRSVVNACLEQKRAVKDIGASLESKPTVYISDKDLYHKVISTDFADICITSGISVMNDIVPDDAFRISDIHGVGVIFHPAEGKKCARCWKILPEVSDDLCGRCESVVGA